ncbi:MAG: metalloregulator ArsR/SmtB family transcription factor [Polyangiaceae bacterium]
MVDLQPIDRIFHALSDPTRRRMVEHLARGGPLSVSALGAPFEMTLAAVVQHVQTLEECGLVRTEKVGRTRTCRVEPRALASAERWFASRRALMEESFDRLEALLRETDPPAPRREETKKGKSR